MQTKIKVVIEFNLKEEKLYRKLMSKKKNLNFASLKIIIALTSSMNLLKKNPFFVTFVKLQSGLS